MTDGQTLSDLQRQKAEALRARRARLERIANSGTPFANRARNALDWLEEFEATDRSEEVPADV